MNKYAPTKTQADLGLVTVTIFWGTTFILSKIVLADVPLTSFLAIRLNLAALVMAVFAWRYRSELNRGVLLHGVILGLFLFVSYLFQMWGIKYTTASNAGFITGLNVVFVPIFSVFLFRDRPRLASLVGVLLATFGLYLLSGGDYTTLNRGDWLVFICSITVTFHVIFTGKFAPKDNIYLLTAIQLLTTGILSLSLAVIDGSTIPSFSLNTTLLMVYLAIFGTVYTFLMQTAMQRYTTATRTALVFSLEPVFAALFAFWFADELLTDLGWFGGGFILLGMLIAEIKWVNIFNSGK